MRNIVKMAYYTGWRLREITSREWRHVDRGEGVVRLEHTETKDRGGRTFPFDVLPDLRAVFDEQWEYTKLWEQRRGQRSACRNLIRSGVPQNIAMRLTGHRTPSIFVRYDIVSEDDLRTGVAKLAAHKRAPGGNTGRNPAVSAI